MKILKPISLFIILIGITIIYSCKENSSSVAKGEKEQAELIKKLKNRPDQMGSPSKSNKLVKEIYENTVKFTDGTQMMLPFLKKKGTNVFFLVRHAEKMPNQDNPDLTNAGKERATNLSLLLRNADLDNIYSTDTKRTLQTALPTLQAYGIKKDSYEANQLKQFAQDLMKGSKGKRALIVGHSNTTPNLVNHFKGKQVYKNIDEKDYGKLYIVAAEAVGKAEVLEFNY